jgi:hypothetical protein
MASVTFEDTEDPSKFIIHVDGETVGYLRCHTWPDNFDIYFTSTVVEKALPITVLEAIVKKKTELQHLY